MVGYNEIGEDTPPSMRTPGGITAQHMRIGNGLQKLDELLKVFEERLSPVLQTRPHGTEGSRGEDGFAKDTSIDSPMVETIASMADRLEKNIGKVAHMLERIDI